MYLCCINYCEMLKSTTDTGAGRACIARVQGMLTVILAPTHKELCSTIQSLICHFSSWGHLHPDHCWSVTTGSSGWGWGRERFQQVLSSDVICGDCQRAGLVVFWLEGSYCYSQTQKVYWFAKRLDSWMVASKANSRAWATPCLGIPRPQPHPHNIKWLYIECSKEYICLRVVYMWYHNYHTA